MPLVINLFLPDRLQPLVSCVRALVGVLNLLPQSRILLVHERQLAVRRLLLLPQVLHNLLDLASARLCALRRERLLGRPLGRGLLELLVQDPVLAPQLLDLGLHSGLIRLDLGGFNLGSIPLRLGLPGLPLGFIHIRLEGPEPLDVRSVGNELVVVQGLGGAPLLVVHLHVALQCADLFRGELHLFPHGSGLLQQPGVLRDKSLFLCKALLLLGGVHTPLLRDLGLHLRELGPSSLQLLLRCRCRCGRLLFVALVSFLHRLECLVTRGAHGLVLGEVASGSSGSLLRTAGILLGVLELGLKPGNGVWLASSLASGGLGRLLGRGGAPHYCEGGLLLCLLQACLEALHVGDRGVELPLQVFLALGRPAELNLEGCDPGGRVRREVSRGAQYVPAPA
mmetsp:Transcript_7067/g.21203  ORF Transcript_7067/g.21203 Transcript_7067/m.21203 type:complete len:395 (-) Transcript_7067:2478-3662(-)